MDVSHISRPALMGQLHSHKQRVPRVEEEKVQDVIDVVETSKGNNVGEIANDIVATANHEIKKNDNKFWLTAMATALTPLLAVASPPIALGLLCVGAGKAGYHLVKSVGLKQQASQRLSQIEDRAKDFAANSPGVKGAQLGAQAVTGETWSPSWVSPQQNRSGGAEKATSAEESLWNYNREVHGLPAAETQAPLPVPKTITQF